MSDGKGLGFLDADESDSEQSQGYDSEADQAQKGRRSSKRRKLDVDDASEDGGPEEPADASDDVAAASAADLNGTGDGGEGKGNPVASVSRPLKRKNLVASEAAVKKSGVVYISRIPPFMKHRKLRALLEPYGKINRIYMAEEDATARKKRVKKGGNRRRLFLEGWVEFVNKKEAKRVCELLNGRNIGGKKRSYHYDSMWTLLYLKSFKWHHLTDQIAAENASRESRMRAEISKAQRENRDFVSNVQKAKMLDTIRSKRKNRDEGPVPEDTEAANNDGGNSVPHGKAKRQKLEKTRTFRQKLVADKANKAGQQQPERVARVLSGIF